MLWKSCLRERRKLRGAEKEGNGNARHALPLRRIGIVSRTARRGWRKSTSQGGLTWMKIYPQRIKSAKSHKIGYFIFGLSKIGENTRRDQKTTKRELCEHKTPAKCRVRNTICFNICARSLGAKARKSTLLFLFCWIWKQPFRKN